MIYNSIGVRDIDRGITELSVAFERNCCLPHFQILLLGYNWSPTPCYEGKGGWHASQPDRDAAECAWVHAAQLDERL